MRAWILKEQKKIEEKPLKMVDDYPTPEPGEGEIRIKIEYCGICRTDLHIAEGDIPLHKKPVIIGHEIVGKVDKLGRGAKRFKIGDRVGISWLNWTCGECKFCRRGEENFCPDIKCTGWDADGGFAEYTKINENFAYDLTRMSMAPEDMAPLMCPGVAGYFAFKLSEAKIGDKLGMVGFGPTAYYLLRVANYLGIDVYISTRSEYHKETAKRYGAKWVGNIGEEDMPEKMNSIIFFPTAGNLVERALENLEVSGILVLAAVSMSPIHIENYTGNLWGKRIKTLYQVRRDYGEEFLKIANKINLTIDKKIVDFEEIQDEMISMKKGETKSMVSVAKIGI